MMNGQMMWRPQTEARPIPWDQFVREVMSLYGPAMKAHATRRGMAHAIKVVSDLGVVQTDDLTTQLIAQLLASRPATNSPNTNLGLLRYVQAACTFAWKSGYLAVSPFHIVALGKWVKAVPAGGKKWHTREEIARVLALMTQHVKERDGFAGWKARRLLALTSVLAYCGLRASEALWLHAVADIDLENRMLYVVSRASHRTKTLGSAAPVAMPLALIPILRDEWLPYRLSAPPGVPVDLECPFLFPTLRRLKTAPWCSGYPGTKPRDQMRAVAFEAGVVAFTPLSLRHSYGTHAESWGLGAMMLQRQMRHSSTRTAEQWYRHAAHEGMREATKDINFE